MISLKSLKKFLVLSGAAFSVSIVGVQTLRAQDAGSNAGGSAGTEIILLQQIANNTLGVLNQVNNLQNVLQAVALLATAWITPDDSEVTSQQLVPNFTALGKLVNSTQQAQVSMQPAVNSAIFANIKPEDIPYANDLTFSTLLGAPFLPKDPRDTSSKKVDSSLNYIYNASGVFIPHIAPNLSWQGSTSDQDKYQAYYSAVIAAQTYDAYILSQQYADKNQYNEVQTALVTQASDAQNWMAKVASENIGWVLRQLLLYQSQSLVLMTQIVQTQKQIASATAMNNTLLIANNQQWEDLLLSKAQGVKPT